MTTTEYKPCLMQKTLYYAHIQPEVSINCALFTLTSVALTSLKTHTPSHTLIQNQGKY